MEAAQQPMIGIGRFIDGKWYCECELAAKCLTVKKAGPNQGRKFWRCGKTDNQATDDQAKECTFFLWDEHVAAAKEWLGITPHQPAPPKTPTRNGNQSEAVDQPSTAGVYPTRPLSPPETPFTLAKRKRNVNTTPGQSSTSNETPISAERGPPPMFNVDSPSKKAARISKLSTPSQSFTERLRAASAGGAAAVTEPQFPESEPGAPSRHAGLENVNDAVSAPKTPPPEPIGGNDSNDNDTATLSEFDLGGLESDGRVFDAEAGLQTESGPEAALTSKILALLKEQNVVLKGSVQMQLRHEIELEIELREAKVRVFEGTIRRQNGRIDELESIVLNLT